MVLCSEPDNFFQDKILSRDLSFKTKDIAWIVSHCETDSHRERYVDALRNWTTLQIDVFGECGKENLKLPPRPEETEYGTLVLLWLLFSQKVIKSSGL